MSTTDVKGAVPATPLFWFTSEKAINQVPEISTKKYLITKRNSWNDCRMVYTKYLITKRNSWADCRMVYIKYLLTKRNS